jgi:hypothetical protein
MARLDEQKPVNDENVEPVSDEARKGDVLGLSGSDVPKTPDLSAEYDPESITQRPESARVGEVLGLAPKSEDPTQNTDTTGLEKGGRRSDADGAGE